MSHVTSTMLSRYIGIRLRRFRDALKMSQETAAEHINVTRRTVIRMEAGESKPSMGNLRSLLDLYGVTDVVLRSDLELMLRNAGKPGWWSTYVTSIREFYAMYVEIEQTASVIHIYGSLVVPGIMQTEAYARAVQTLSMPSSADPEVLINLRMERQRRLFAQSPLPDMSVILDESILHRRIGSPEVMAEQLRHIADLAELGHITVRVVPQDSGRYLTPEPFAIFRPGLGVTIAYIDGHLTWSFHEEPEDIAKFTEAFARCRTAALAPGASIAALRDHADVYMN